MNKKRKPTPYQLGISHGMTTAALGIIGGSAHLEFPKAVHINGHTFISVEHISDAVQRHPQHLEFDVTNYNGRKL